MKLHSWNLDVQDGSVTKSLAKKIHSLGQTVSIWRPDQLTTSG